MQGGKYAAEQIERRLRGEPPGEPFKYFDKGSMATISRFHAVASVGNRLHFAGFFAWVMWLLVHVMYLVGFKNRFTTMLHWAVSFVLRGRSQRTTTRQQIVARTRLARLEAEQAQLQEAAVESSAAAVVDERGAGAGKQSEVVETDSVDQLSAAYGDKDAEDPDTAPLKQAPES
jgi:hypothetical protein